MTRIIPGQAQKHYGGASRRSQYPLIVSGALIRSMSV